MSFRSLTLPSSCLRITWIFNQLIVAPVFVYAFHRDLVLKANFGDLQIIAQYYSSPTSKMLKDFSCPNLKSLTSRSCDW